MIDQLMGLIMVGLGIQTPIQGVVQGDSTEATSSPTARNDKTIKKVEEKRRQAIESAKGKRQEFETKRQGLKDQRKKEILSKLQEKLTNVNSRQTKLMSEHLAKMTSILDRLEKAAGNLAITVDVSAARAAITSAQAAVTAQAGKEYVIAVGSDSTVKNDAGQTRKSLEADLKAARSLVVTARKSVKDAVETFAKARGKARKENVSPTPTE